MEHIFNLPELKEAIASGFVHAFAMLPDGSLRCTADFHKTYNLEELSLTVVPCQLLPASLYLITAIDGVRGTLLDYWEHPYLL